MRVLFFLCMTFCVFGCQSNQKKGTSMANPTVTIRTNQGDIQVELFSDSAPLTVANFLRYVDEKFYNKTIFHRVIDGFMIQGGGLSADLKRRKPMKRSTMRPIIGFLIKRGRSQWRAPPISTLLLPNFTSMSQIIPFSITAPPHQAALGIAFLAKSLLVWRVSGRSNLAKQVIKKGIKTSLCKRLKS